MIKALKIVFVAAMAVAMTIGCARNTGLDTSEHENEALAAWMDKNYEGWQNSKDWMRTSDGTYILWLRRAQLEGKADTVLASGDWVRINYTGKRLDGSVFYTRSEAVAKIQGTYSRRTHYVPDFVHLYQDNALLPKGIYEALTNMKNGDMVRVIMPSGSYMSSSGYSSTNVGYNGQFGLPGDVPVIVDSLEIMEVVKYPVKVEEDNVAEYVQRNWNMNPADSLEGHVGLYVQLQNPYPFKRDSVVKDSTLTCYYKAYFLDGFVFDSNIDSVQMRAWGEIYNEGPMEWDMKSSEVSMIDGFKKACCQACYGDHIRTIFTSAYGYAISGSAAKAISSSSSSSDFDYNSYYNALNYYTYMNNMYGGGYGYGGYGSYGGYYDNYYNSMYYASLYDSMYNSSSSSSSTEDEDEESKVTITSEILPFTPLIFEIWVCADNGSQEAPDHSSL